MKKFVLCFLMLMATSRVWGAEAVTFEATVNSPRVSLDEVLQLTLTVNGVNDNLDPVSLPVIDGFTAKYVGPSSSTSYVFANGKSEQSSSRSFIYNLFPNKAGKYQIPSISATIAGQTYRTQPIDIEVFETPSQVPASGGPSGQQQAGSAESLKDKIMVIATVDKNNAYINERIPLTIKFLVNGVSIRDIQPPQFEKKGFLIDDYEKPQQSSGIFNGVRYDSIEFKTNIYPDRSGDLTIGPVQIQVDVLYKTGQNNPFDQENSLFGGNVFNNLFDTYTTRPVTVSSQPILLHVSPLPEENRPNDFYGAIGRSFDFQANVSPLKVKAGDPLTLKMDVKGDGNLKDLKMPEIQADGFKVYAPQIKGQGDEKTAQVVLIPTSAGTKEVPALHFSYFDTSLKDYKTITQGPFTIHVTAPSPDQEFKAVGFSDVSKGLSNTVSDQFSFGRMFKKVQQFIKKLWGSIWFWTSLGFILAAGASYFFWRRFQDRLKNDPAFARRFKALKEARKALVLAEEYIPLAKTKELYALLSKVLRDYLANKWHQPSASLNVEEILGHLRSTQIDEALITQVKAILSISDMVCFAGANRDAGQMRADLQQTRDLIARLEKYLK